MVWRSKRERAKDDAIQALKNEVAALQNWKLITEELERAQGEYVSRLESDLVREEAFLRWLAETVPDYEGFVLKYMEENPDD